MAQSELEKEVAENVERLKPALFEILKSGKLDFLVLVTFRGPSTLVTIPVGSNSENTALAGGCAGLCLEALQRAAEKSSDA